MTKISTNEVKLIADHKTICQEFLFNIEKYVNYSKLSKATKYNWRTCKNHIMILSCDKKIREKANDILAKEYAEIKF